MHADSQLPLTDIQGALESVVQQVQELYALSSLLPQTHHTAMQTCHHQRKRYDGLQNKCIQDCQHKIFSTPFFHWYFDVITFFCKTVSRKLDKLQYSRNYSFLVNWRTFLTSRFQNLLSTSSCACRSLTVLQLASRSAITLMRIAVIALKIHVIFE